MRQARLFSTTKSNDKRQKKSHVSSSRFPALVSPLLSRRARAPKSLSDYTFRDETRMGLHRSRLVGASGGHAQRERGGYRDSDRRRIDPGANAARDSPAPRGRAAHPPSGSPRRTSARAIGARAAR